jgi:hypothetical protein
MSAIVVLLNLSPTVKIVMARGEEADKFRLLALGIMEEEDFAEPMITRGEMAAIVMRLNGVYDVGVFEGIDSFTDVDASNEYYGYIEYANRLRLMVGHDGQFQPERPVTGVEAVKILISVLGYDIAAERDGGYPMGYIFWAYSLGITNGSIAVTEAPLPRNDAIALISNAMDIEMLDVTTAESRVLSLTQI